MSWIRYAVPALSMVVLLPVGAGAGGSNDFTHNGPSVQAAEGPVLPTDPGSDGAFGLNSQWTVIHVSRWAPWAGSSTPFYVGNSGYIYPAVAGDDYWTQIDLPAGAVIDAACFLVRDSTDTGRWSKLDFHAYESAFPNPNPVSPHYVSFGTQATTDVDTPGYVQLCVTATVTVRAFADLNADGESHYVAYALTAESDGAATTSLALFGGRIFWHRSLSPSPAVATFVDVPVGSFGFQHIEALVASGITAGCGGGAFCPDAPLTRAQMAVFLAKALGLHWPS